MFSPSSSRSLTIAFLRRGYSSSGGVEVYFKGLASGLHREGHRVILIGTAEWPSEEWPGGEILRCSGKSLKSYITEVERHKEGCGIPFDIILSVEKMPGCDLYRTDEGVHLAWLTERQKYITLWARCFQWINPKHREKLALEKKLFSADSTRRVISLSEKITRDIITLYGYPPKQIRMIRNGVAQLGVPTLDQRNQARHDLGITPEEKVVLFVGTGWERKGLRFAIRAVERLAEESRHRGVGGGEKKWVLLVAGKGQKKHYGSPIIRFLGPLKGMESIYEAADILIAPTIFDPFPLSILEALSAGLPVIISAAAGVSEIMTGGLHGEVIKEPSDITALTEALRKWSRITDDPELSASTRSACLALASTFTRERNLCETLALIHEVIAEKEKSTSDTTFHHELDSLTGSFGARLRCHHSGYQR
jgi:UDP-glucose:(heptosyl)LPS alpha-1,3-glucosyltransferase